MATPHINAEMGAFADVVLMPGDPLRAKYIAETKMMPTLARKPSASIMTKPF